MPDKTAVIDPVKSASGKEELNNPSDKGQSPSEKELENRIRENLRGEYARKTEELSTELEETRAEKADLEEKIRLSEAEKAKLARLRNKEDDLEEEVRILESDPKYRAYNEKIERRSNKAKEEAKAEAKHEMYLEMAVDLIEESADKEGIDAKQLRKELNTILLGNKYGDQNPLKRAKLAMRDRTKLRELIEREDKIKKKEAELNGHLEDGKNTPREKSLEEAKNSDDTLARAKALGL